jgi:hypothetical protein
MSNIRSLAAASALVAALAACGTPAPELSDDLSRDLAAARSASVDLAPRSGNRTQVVSAEEQSARATLAAPRVAPRAPAGPAARSTVRRNAPPSPEASAVAEAPAPQPAPVAEPAAVEAAPVDAAPAVTGPLRRPDSRNPEPPGGYRSVGDVIRNAPFPINP